MLGIKPESILFQKEEFNSQNIIDALRNEPQKCPVITAADFTDYFNSGGPPTLADQWFIKCKNSYGNDPNQPGEIQ